MNRHHPSHAERLARLLPPDAARQIMAWLDQSEPGDHMLVTIRKEPGGGVAVQLPAWFSWGEAYKRVDRKG